MFGKMSYNVSWKNGGHAHVVYDINAYILN